VKIGAENRTKLISAVVLMVLALILLGRWMFSSGGDSPAAANSPATVAAPTTLPPAVRGRVRGKKANDASRSLDPSLRYDWLKASEATKYEGKGRNIFRAQIDIPRPEKIVRTDVAPPPPPGPPPPPPINLKFFGFASKPGEPKKIFLSQGEDVFIAGEGEIVDRRYRILRISPMSVEVEDVLNNNHQSIPLTQG
jgi:hypothetical protein